MQKHLRIRAAAERVRENGDAGVDDDNDDVDVEPTLPGVFSLDLLQRKHHRHTVIKAHALGVQKLSMVDIR